MTNSPIEENDMVKKRRKFDAGIRLQVMRMILAQGISVAQISQDMEPLARHWIGHIIDASA